MNFIEKNNVSFIPQADKILIDPKSIRSILSRLKTNKKRFQPATGFNILTIALRAFELESIDGFERYSTTIKSYAVPSQIVPQNSQFIPQKSQFVPHMKSQVHFSKFVE